KLRLAFELGFPFLGFYGEQFAELFLRDAVDLIQVEILRPRNVSDRRFAGAGLPFTTSDDPLEHTHVVAESRPEKFSAGVFPEPVHVENQRRILQPRADLEPVPEIISHAVAAK